MVIKNTMCIIRWLGVFNLDDDGFYSMLWEIGLINVGATTNHIIDNLAWSHASLSLYVIYYCKGNQPIDKIKLISISQSHHFFFTSTSFEMWEG